MPTLQERRRCHGEILDAAEHLEFPSMLAWAIHDQKPEKFVTVALAAELNRKVRRAWTEHKRWDLVLVDDASATQNPSIEMAYEARAEHVSWFLRSQSSTPCRKDDARGEPRKTSWWWRGGSLRWDLKECAEARLRKKWGRCFDRRAGLFYLVHVDPPTTQDKFGGGKSSLTVSDAKRSVEHCVGLRAFAWKRCAQAVTLSIAPSMSATVEIHVGVFDYELGTTETIETVPKSVTMTTLP